MWGSERQGAMNNALSGRKDSLCCFCSHCEKKGRERGINVERARQGILALHNFVEAGRARRRPVDGYFVEFWRLLLRYPEILAWESLWTDNLHQTYRTLYARAKAVRPDLLMGWHIWHTNSFSPFYRAEQDLQELAQYSDYLKVVMYNNCGGPRIAGFVDNIQPGIFGDFTKEETLELLYRIQNYREPGYAEIPTAGLSPDYVYREAKRAVDGAAGTQARIWPGIDVDIPAGKTYSGSTPANTKASVSAAFRAGVDGIILSRKYSEMRLANLSAVGEAVREFGDSQTNSAAGPENYRRWRGGK
jgi:hypothetical protein